MPALNPRTNSTATIATKYVVFAAVATGCNLGTQALLDLFYRGPLALYVSLAVGTLVGLAVKYVLDKNFIFYDSTRGLARSGRQFVRYALTGVLTTAVFWGMELGFYAAFGTRTGRYSGGALGLALGYWLKYHLDRRLVFSPAAGHRAPRLERRSVLEVLASMLRLMRPRQWIKNVFVFAPLLFAGRFLHPDSLLHALAAAALFCVASSSTYVLNDLMDLEQDRRHPVKSRRPLASGEVSPRQAKMLLGCLWALLLPGLLLSVPMMGAILGYLLLNLAYSISLKHVPVVDIFCVAGGFVLRAYAGALAIDVSLSQWMLISTLCLTLYLAAGKRRHELATNGTGSRGVLEHYTVQLMDLYGAMAAVGALVFYGIFTIMHQPKLTATIPLAIFGIFRYWYMVERGSGDDSPTDALIADPWLVVTVVSWIGITIWVLWPK